MTPPARPPPKVVTTRCPHCRRRVNARVELARDLAELAFAIAAASRPELWEQRLADRLEEGAGVFITLSELTTHAVPADAEPGSGVAP